MKASRDQLKALVRSLMIEILSEGLGNLGVGPVPGLPAPIGEHRLANGRRKPAFDARLDTPLVGGRQPTDALRHAIHAESGGNPMMAAILADTARTTLPSQLSGGDAMGMPSEGVGHSASRIVQQEQFAGNPDDIFEGAAVRPDGSSHWADLAFMGSGKKSA